MSYSVRQICERFNVTQQTVLRWIQDGQLAALNVARRLGGKRPTWRVSEQAIEAFEALRTATPPPPRSTRRRRQTEGIRFY
jgi:excisionase family DNA binding protein